MGELRLVSSPVPKLSPLIPTRCYQTLPSVLTKTIWSLPVGHLRHPGSDNLNGRMPILEGPVPKLPEWIVPRGPERAVIFQEHAEIPSAIKGRDVCIHDHDRGLALIGRAIPKIPLVVPTHPPQGAIVFQKQTVIIQTGRNQGDVRIHDHDRVPSLGVGAVPKPPLCIKAHGPERTVGLDEQAMPTAGACTKDPGTQDLNRCFPYRRRAIAQAAVSIPAPSPRANRWT